MTASFYKVPAELALAGSDPPAMIVHVSTDPNKAILITAMTRQYLRKDVRLIKIVDPHQVRCRIYRHHGTRLNTHKRATASTKDRGWYLDRFQSALETGKQDLGVNSSKERYAKAKPR